MGGFESVGRSMEIRFGNAVAECVAAIEAGRFKIACSSLEGKVREQVVSLGLQIQRLAPQDAPKRSSSQLLTIAVIDLTDESLKSLFMTFQRSYNQSVRIVVVGQTFSDFVIPQCWKAYARWCSENSSRFLAELLRFCEGRVSAKPVDSPLANLVAESVAVLSGRHISNGDTSPSKALGTDAAVPRAPIRKRKRLKNIRLDWGRVKVRVTDRPM